MIFKRATALLLAAVLMYTELSYEPSVLPAGSDVFMPVQEEAENNESGNAGEGRQDSPSESAPRSTIKWASFNIPYSAMDKALRLDIRSHSTEGVRYSWVDILAVLGAKYGGDWKRYRSRDMDAVVKKMKEGVAAAQIAGKFKNYNYFHEVYDAILGDFTGYYSYNANPYEGDIYTDKYGLKAFSPIPSGYGYSHYDDFGDSRSFGFRRRHLGNDLLGSIGTPIVAVEGGTVEELGWNRYGGWRIGIRSLDRKRYYYYAHLRRGHPYRSGLEQGQTVRAGDVIGYLGMTGYSTDENVNGMTQPHLHFGMQILFDPDSPRESNNEIWINVYNIVNILERHRSPIVRIGKGEYREKGDFVDPGYLIS